MTSQQAQIQELLQSIDMVLSKASPRLPWVMAGEAEQQRQVLEQTRQYLLDLQQGVGSADLPTAIAGTPIAGALPAGIAAEELRYPAAPAPGESAQQVLQAVLQEVTYLRTNIMQPMRDDVEELRQERAALRQEVKELQAQRQQYALPAQEAAIQPALTDFLHSLMGRLQENLTVQVSEMLSTMEGRSDRALPGSASTMAGLSQFDSTTGEAAASSGESSEEALRQRAASAIPALSPRERLEQLQQIHAQSDQLLLKLDTTLHVIFESLQRNIQTYEESLSQGLDKMHTLGHQGEAIFAALINRLAQQLGREASQYLQSSIEATDWQQALPQQTQRGDRHLTESQNRGRGDRPGDDLDFLLDELTDNEATILQPPPGQSFPPAGSRSASRSLDQDLADLELEPSIPGRYDFTEPSEMTMFQMDDDAPMTVFQSSQDDDEMTIFQMGDPPESMAGVTAAELDNSIDDIDSALELLNQISTDLETDHEDPEETPEAASPEGIYNELDALYESLFGTDISPPAEAFEGEAPIDRHIADAKRMKEDEIGFSDPEFADLAASDLAAVAGGNDEAEVDIDDVDTDDFERQLFEGLADLTNADDAEDFLADLEMASTEIPGEETLEDDATAQGRDTTPVTEFNLLFDAESDGDSFDADGISGSEDELADLSPQAVESLLFDEVPVADEGEQEETLLLDLSTKQGQPLPADVITSLEDLAIAVTEPDALSALRSEDLRSDDLRSDDIYIPAAPDEDLLMAEEVPQSSRFALDIDDAVIEQLNAELAQLEQGQVGSAPYPGEAEDVTEPYLDGFLNPELSSLAADLEADLETAPTSPDEALADLLGLGSETSLESEAPLDPDELLEALDPDAVDPDALDSTEAFGAPTASSDLFEIDFSDTDFSGTIYPADYPAESVSDEPVSDEPVSDEPVSHEPASDESAMEAAPELTLEFDLDALDSGESLPALDDGAPAPPLMEWETEGASVTTGEELNLADSAFAGDDASTAANDVADLNDLADLFGEPSSDEEPEEESLGTFGDIDTLLATVAPEPTQPGEGGAQPAFEGSLADFDWDGDRPADLTPDREDLTLELFQEVMATPPIEVVPAVFSSYVQPEEEPDTTPPPEETDTLDSFADSLNLETLLEVEPEEIAPEAAASFASEIAAVDEDQITDDRAETTLELAAWFAEVDDVPEPVEVSPPLAEAEDPEADALTELILQSGRASSTDAPARPMESMEAEENAFTLEGLGDLFEPDVPDVPDVPSTIDTTDNQSNGVITQDDRWQGLFADDFPELGAPTPAADPGETASELFGELENLGDLATDFGQAEFDPADLGTQETSDSDGFELDHAELEEFESEAIPEAEAVTDESSESPESLEADAKKKRSVIPPEDLGSTLPRSADADEWSPLMAEDPAELLFQAMGLAGEDDWAEAGGLIDPESLSEMDLTLMDLSADLLGDADEDADPDLLALLQRARNVPLEPDNDPLAQLRDQEEDLDFLLAADADPLDEGFLRQSTLPGMVAKPLPDPTWFLGLDIGTTGLSAVLCNRKTQTLYPLYWLEIKFPGAAQGSFPIPKKTFRLPASVYLSPMMGAMPGAAAGVAIASLSTPQADFGTPTRQPVRDFKPYLRLGVPYYTAYSPHWEPSLQWTDQRTLPLSGLHQGLRALLATLNNPIPEPQNGSDAPLLSFGAVGLEDAALQQALQDLAGVIVSHPANWSDTYGFNLREAVLAARLVAEPDQVILVEEAIATLLSALQPDPPQAITLPAALTPIPNVFQAHWQGGTLVVNGGASVTELAIANLPARLQTLGHSDIALRSVAYGGTALDQDLICQLIYPAWMRHAQGDRAMPNPPDLSNPEAEAPFTPSIKAHWEDPWVTLGWETLMLPVVGDPDPANRHRVQQRLLSSAVGLALLETARYLKGVLQERDRASVQLGTAVITLTRQDLGSRVLLPYIQRLNRELNALFTQSGLTALDIKQVLCSGGTASMGAIARWLRQKLPNATIQQDTYAPPESPTHTHLPICSRVAYGLATIPLYPQVVDASRHQYNDYFLLMELLRIFPDAPITLASLLQTLDRRGINTQRCQPNLLALLEGRLPPGLVPLERDTYALAPDSLHNPDYQSLLTAPLFVREGPQTYRPNPAQWQLLRQYLDTVLSSSYQKLGEPLPFTLESLVPTRE